jgi:HAD superfamily phosphatase
MTKLAIIVFDIDGVIRDVSKSYRRAIADTVEYFTAQAYRPSMEDLDLLKSEGIWNNDWKVSQELTYRYFEAQGQNRETINLNYEDLVTFFQTRYRGTDPVNFNGYIQTEPLLVQKNYFEILSTHRVGWGFFSGATRGSAEFILKQRIGLENPILVAMEDAPEKPEPEGLFKVIHQISDHSQVNLPVIYVGDTVADMYTVRKAQAQEPSRVWLGVGILPPHVLGDESKKANYTQTLKQAGAVTVMDNVEMLTPVVIEELLHNH